ncbi:MAG: YceI family protein [Chitinophagales bacterium]|nr:YceI family protein [Chitinophagales bacterium]
MKRAFLAFGLGAFLLASCVDNPEGVKAEVQDAVEVEEAIGNELTINTKASTIEWTGRKVSATHHGLIKIEAGDVVIAGDHLIGGRFIIDMASLENLDQQGEWKGKLEGHLKSEDFFGVESYPQAILEITNVNGNGVGTVTISANLTIKDITKNVTFEAQVLKITEDSFTATADFNINRFDWGIEYPGKADDLISKEINFKININAGVSEEA